MTTVGFVGLGEMGSRVARRLLEAGHTLTVYNRTPSKARELLDAGARWGESPRAVALTSEITFSMVTNTKALQAVAEGPDGILSAMESGKVYAEMSTVSPAFSRELAARVAEKGARMLDVPISGASITVEEGKATLMVGGDRETFERIKPVLLDIGPKATYVGPNGLALVMKIATNLSLAVQMQAFSEGVLLAEKSGIPREVAVDVLVHSVIASPMVKYRGPFVLEMPDRAWFDVNMMQKDMLLALDLGRELDVPMPTTSVTNEMLTATRGMGMAAQDFAVMFHALARMSGLES